MTSRSGTVPVPRAVLVALVAALALAVLLAVFLLGRQSVRVGPRVEASHADAPADETAAGRTDDSVKLSSPHSESAAELAPTPAPLPPTPPAPSIAAVTAPQPGEREEVARYFQETESIQARAKYWSDPQSLAKTILEQAAGGNSGGFDELVRAQKNARTELERLAVPPACAEHHRRSLAVMGEGVALLERVQGAVSSGDLAGLDGLAGASRDLEREAREIDALGRSIKQRYGS